AGSRGMAAQSAWERQRIKERASELEVEVLSGEIGVPQRHEPRVAGGQRREAAGHGAAAFAHSQRVESDFEHALAMRFEPHAAREHGAGREAPIDEVEVAE